ncbi:MAG: hypothetical protein KAY50_11085 [Chitinophagaceae bacterium]|nr:hypothetical protein [Chitinophagaceae bacterium]
MSLLEKPKHKKEYSFYLKDIQKALSKFQVFDDAFNAHNFNLEVGGMVQIKHEIKNSNNSRGARDGYRLIFLCIPDKDEDGNLLMPKSGKVYLLDIYPKRGGLETTNLTDDRFVELIELCLNDISNELCTPFKLK